ncbi:hypothetical protein V8C86DRAFT_2614386 [Haematococcus lacustris]
MSRGPVLSLRATSQPPPAAQDDLHTWGVVVIAGVSGSGKSTIAQKLSTRLGQCQDAEGNGCPWIFLEGDDFHPPTNKSKMASGQPLTDTDRWPWLLAVRAACQHHLDQGRRVVVACSALRHTYRQILANQPAAAITPTQQQQDQEQQRKHDSHDEGQGRDQGQWEGQQEYQQQGCQEVPQHRPARGYSSAQPVSPVQLQDTRFAASWPRVAFVLLDPSEATLRVRLQARGATNHFMPPSLLESQLSTLEREPLSDWLLILDASSSDRAAEEAIEDALRGTQRSQQAIACNQGSE